MTACLWIDHQSPEIFGQKSFTNGNGALQSTRHMTRMPVRAFTVIEILIVVVILAVLAAIVVPRFSSATTETRESALKMEVYRIRTQLAVYKSEHQGNWPTAANFTEQLIFASDTQGNTAMVGTRGYPYGPYLRRFPVNPFTLTSTVGNDAIGTSDWYYDESNGEFRANDTSDNAIF